MAGISDQLRQDLFLNFRAAVTEALVVAGLSALVAAVIASLLVSREVAAPVRAMMDASQRIAEGHYDERVRLPQDPDELGELALRFNQMAERLEQIESMRRQLIGDVSHELRTPLAVIKGSMEGLIDGVLPAEAETFSNIYQEADRLQRLVNDLQELSRVEAGAYSLNQQPVQLPELIKSVTQRLARQYEDKGVSLSTQIPGNLPPALGDEDRLGQVLVNLVGNALQYTPSGGSVTILARQAGNQLEVAIQDSGIGIPAAHLPHIFTRFYRVDKSRSRAGGGSGIGLTSARPLVEAHGGRLWAASAGEGKGSTFTFSLPVAS
jgi:histidine kinase